MCKIIFTNLFGAGADLKRFHSNLRHFYANLRHFMRSFVVGATFFSGANDYAFCMSVLHVGFQNDESKMISKYFPSKYLDTV